MELKNPPSRSSKYPVHVAMLVALALVAVSCGGDDVGEGDVETTTAASTSTTTSTTATSTTHVPTSTTSETSTTSTSTTLAPPSPDPEAVAFIEEWAALMNGGDHEAAADMVVAARQWDAPGGEEATRLFFEVWVLLDSELAVDECLARSTGITQCRITRHVELSPHAPEPETSLLRARFDDDGSLAYAGTVPIQSDPWFGPYLAFKQWTLDTYGTGPDSPYTALFNVVEVAEYEQLLVEQLAIWRAQQEG